MSRTSYGFAAVSGGTLLLAAFYAAGLYVPMPGLPDSFLSAAGAAAVILINGVGLALTGRHVSLRTSVLIPFIYIALVAVNPAALHWSAFHPASLLLLASTFCYLHFCAIQSSIEYLAASSFLLGAAGLFVPPILWLFPLLLLLGAGRTAAKGKGLITAVIGLVLPLLILGSLHYIRGGIDAVQPILPDIWEKMSAIHPGIRHLSAATLIRLLVTLAATLMAVVHIVRHLNTYKTVQALSFVRLITLSAVLCLMMLLFPADNRTPCGLAVCLPVTLLLNEYFTAPGKRRAKVSLAVVLCLLLAAERVSQLL